MKKRTSLIPFYLFILWAELVFSQPESFPVLDPGGHTDIIAALLPVQNGQKLISVGADKTVRVMDGNNGQTLKVWRLSVSEGPTDELLAACLSPDERWLAVGGNLGPKRNELLVFDWQNGAIKKRFTANTNGVRSLLWSPDGKMLFSGGKDSLIRVFETETFKETAQLKGQQSQVRTLSASPDGKYIVSTALDALVYLWKRESTWAGVKPTTLQGHEEIVENTAFSPDGRYVFSAGADGKVLKWAVKGGEPQVMFNNRHGIWEMNNQASQVAISPSGKQWAVAEIRLNLPGSKDPVFFHIRVYDDKGNLTTTFKSHKQTVFQVRFMDERTLASADGINNIFIWNLDGAAKVSLPAPTAMVPSVALVQNFQADFALLSGITDKERLNCSFDWATLTFTPNIGGRNPVRETLIHEQGGKKLEQADDYHLRTVTGAIIASKLAKDRIQRYTFTPDGNILVLFDRTLCLYSPDGVPIRNFEGLGSTNKGLALSANGQFAIVSTQSSGLQQLWHLPSGDLCATLFVRPTDNAWVCWAPQGWFAASPGGEDMLNWYVQDGQSFFKLTPDQAATKQRFKNAERLKKNILEKQNATLEPRPKAIAHKPELVLSVGHGTVIEEIVFSPDGNLVATAGSDNFIKVWELKTNKLLTDISNLDGQIGGFQSVQFSRDSRLILTTSKGGDALILYDVLTGERKRGIPAAGIKELAKARFSPDETRVVTTANPQKAVQIWQIGSEKPGQLADLPGVNDIADDAAFTPDGKQVIAVCRDRRVLFWDAGTFQLLRHVPLPLPSGDWDSVNFFKLRISPDGRYYAIIDGQVGIVWLGECKRSDKPPRPIHPADTNQIASAIAFSSDSRFLAVGGIGVPFEIIDLQTGQNTILAANPSIQSLAFSPDGQFIATVSGLLHEFKVELWNIVEHRVVSELNRNVPISKCVALSRSGRWLATGNTNNNLNLWDLALGKLQFDLDGTPSESQYDFGIQDIRFSPNDSLVAAASADSNIYVWGVSTGALLHRFHGHAGMATCLDFSQDGRYLVSGDLEKNVLLWDIGSKRLPQKLPRHHAPVTTVCFSNDGKNVVYGNFDTLRICEVKGKTLAVFSPNLRDFTKFGFTDNLKNEMKIGKVDYYDETAELWARKITACFAPDNHTVLFAGGDDGQIGRFDLNTRKKSHLRPPVALFTPVTTMALSRDGRFVALCMRRTGGVDIFDARDGTLLRSVTAHKTSPFGVAFAQQGGRSLLATCANDGYVKLFDWQKSGTELASFIADREGRFTIVAPDNHFFNDRTGVTSMAYKLNGQIFPFEQFDLRFNRPDRVLEQIGMAPKALTGTYQNAWKKRLQKMGFQERDLGDDLQLPTIQIKNKVAQPRTTSQKNIKVQVGATDTQSPLDRLNIFVNDVPVYGIAGINLRPKNTKQHEQTLDIELAPGENKIQVSVLNQAGAESLKETFYVTCTAPPRKPDLYFIGIGSGQFQNKAMNLDFPAKDVRDLAALWAKNKERYGRIVIDTLLQGNVTATKVAALKQKLLQTKVEDQVVLFVAGHGILDDSLDYYLAAYNTDFKQPQNGSIPYDLLDNLLDAIPARQKLMLMDACHAGEIDKESVMPTIEQHPIKGTVKFRSVGTDIANKKLGLENSFELMKELFVDLRRGTGATVIASAGGIEAAMEGAQWNNSVFMYVLLSGLQEKKADSNKDGAVMVSELQSYLGAEVQRLTGGAQRPTSRVENITNDWRIW